VKRPLQVVLWLLALLVLATACSKSTPSSGGSPATTAPEQTASPATSMTAPPAASTTAPPAVATALIPGLSAETIAILDSCLAGSDTSCDKAQEPGRLNDSNFSRLNEACTRKAAGACELKQRLVEAELRMHCNQGDKSSCQPGP
jgi:hypothetical protein